MAISFKDNLTGTFEDDPYINTPLKFLTASSIMGDKVTNNEGEHLGMI